MDAPPTPHIHQPEIQGGNPQSPLVLAQSNNGEPNHHISILDEEQNEPSPILMDRSNMTNLVTFGNKS